MLLLTSCGPSQAQIEQAIAETQAAMPTETPTPEPTRTPTLRPTKTTSPTSTIDIKATQLEEARLKETFSNAMIEILKDDFGCVQANWKDHNTFELVCVKPTGWNEAEPLTMLAYGMTSGGAFRMKNTGLVHPFEPGFTYIVMLLSDDEKTAVKTVTDGEILRMMVAEEITSQLEWEVFAEIEIKTQ